MNNATFTQVVGIEPQPYHPLERDADPRHGHNYTTRTMGNDDCIE